MEKITGIVSIKDLKFPKKPRQPYLRYDRELDVFFILMVPPEIETVAYYVDSHVALLYISKNKEIVGFQHNPIGRDQAAGGEQDYITRNHLLGGQQLRFAVAQYV